MFVMTNQQMLRTDFEIIKDKLATLLELCYYWQNKNIAEIMRGWKSKYSDEDVINALTPLLKDEMEIKEA